MASLEELRKTRIQKREKLEKAGIDPYPAQATRTHTAAQIIQDFDALHDGEERVFAVGRIKSIRRHGGASFIDLADETGTIQVFCEEETLGSEVYRMITEMTDGGDFVEVSGTLFETERGQKTLRADSFRVIAKALRPIPEDFYGLADVEERLRRRYLDFLVNAESRDAIETRSRTIAYIREFLSKKGFLEVETPILQTIAGGTLARPFKTHINAYDLDVYLRIAPELYLKRLLVGGFEKIYEFAKNFRNEGVDAQHNPEFLMLELYAAYRDYQWMMEFMEELVRSTAQEILGATSFPYGEHTINVADSFRRTTFSDVLEKCANIKWGDNEDEFRRRADELGVSVDKSLSKGKIADEIFKKVCRAKIIQPTFVTLYPTELSPLSKKGEAPQGYTERFHLIIGGLELMNGFSEINDPIDQRERFEEQRAQREKGDVEAHPLDEDFLEALEYGMPPAAGVGIGIDRLVALFADRRAIRDVIAFPFVKPKENL